MKGDFTRSTFRSKKHYKSVRMQQGRVQLDADWNEQADILLHRIETGMRDLLGRSAGTNESDGFRIVTDESWIDDFAITAGRYYVSGVLCENDEQLGFRDQPDRRLDGNDDRDVLGAAGYYLVYLDVWTRNITHLDDEDIREPALGGADTTTRAKTVWQVRCEPLDELGDGEPIVPPEDTLPVAGDRIRATTGQLAVKRGTPLVNQLYRIEIDKPGDLENARFKWSRDNGAVVGLVDLGSGALTGDILPLKSIDRRLRPDDWIEIVSEKDELEGIPDDATVEMREQRFFRIKSITGKLIELDRAHGLAAPAGSAEIIKIRRWDRDPQSEPEEEDSPRPPLFPLVDGENEWIRLENDILVKFTPGSYKGGDYWYVPVRVGAKSEGEPAPAPVDGVSHDIAHLAVIRRHEGGAVEVIRDLRRRYIPPADDRGIMYAGGDGQVTPRGTVLPEPLAVYVTGYITRDQVPVRFSLPDGAPGALYGADPNGPEPVAGSDEVTVLTDTYGKARCWWMPMDRDGDGVVAPVTACLLEGGDTETGNEIRFNAWLSNADRVVYDLSARARDALPAQGPKADLQRIVDDVYENLAILHYAGGGGQSGRPGEALAHPLRVRVANGVWATGAQAPRVRFRIVSAAGGTLHAGESEPSDDIDGELIDGVFQCTWTLGAAEGSHEVEAYLYFDGALAPAVTPVRFSAHVLGAHEVVYDTEHNDAVRTVEHALDDLYEQVTRLHHVSGDGQVASRGEVLPQPLVVELSGYTPASDWRVRFEVLVDQSSGVLYAQDPSQPTAEPLPMVEAVTDTNGRAICYWRMPEAGSAGDALQVTATLLDLEGQPTGHELRFHAWLSDADKVRYYLSERAQDALPAQDTQAGLQLVIDNVYENLAILHYAGGDGQCGRPGEMLAQPLRVRVGNGAWATGEEAPRVRFRVASAAGGLLHAGAGEPSDEIDGELIDGMFQCFWTLGAVEGTHEVEAYLYFDGALAPAVTPVHFSAQVLVAHEVMYTNFDHDIYVRTVEEAIDDLYQEVTRLHHVSGDGQVASRGEVLPQPLVVELSGYTPADGWRVRFEVPADQASGVLYAQDPSQPTAEPLPEVEAITNGSGQAICYWRMPEAGSAGDALQVTATLLDLEGQPTEHVLHFRAWLSDADKVRYYLSERAQDALPAQGPHASLQQIIDDVYENLAILHYAGGDGQSGQSGEMLAHPLRVRVGNGAWAAGEEAPRVRFRIVSAAGGTLHAGESESSDEVDGELIDGVFQCSWTLGAAQGPHEVEAYLYFDGAPAPAVTPVRFSAHVLGAHELVYDTEHNDAVQTVEHALDDLYEQVTRLHHVSGDGQVASRGEVLPQPLVVELSGYTPADGWRVRFEVPADQASGVLYAQDPSQPTAEPLPEIEAITNGSGQAICYWRMPEAGSAGDALQVTATLLDPEGQPTEHVLRFHAWLSDADKVRYYLSERAQDALPAQGSQASLQQIIDDVYENLAILHYAGGDGQSGQPGEMLAHPLRVRVGNGAWATGEEAPRVRFRIVSAAGGTLRAGESESSEEVDGELIDGVFQCTWTLGAAQGPHEVEAYLYFDGAPAPAVTPVCFSAHVLASHEVIYENSEHHFSVQTVEQALDDLYEQVVRLHHVSGGGQVASRGEVLPQPLVVELSGYTPASDWRVRFEVPADQSSGVLYAQDPSQPTAEPLPMVEAVTDTNGQAICYWRMPEAGSAGDALQVTATLLDPEGQPTEHVLRFHAWLSDADKVRYSLSERAQDALPAQGSQASLQQIIDDVYENLAILHYAGGDGQSGRPGEMLAHPLRVRVGNGAWATGEEAPRVRFRIVSAAGGTLRAGESEPSDEVDGELIDGVFQCTWTLGAAQGPHEVEAYLYFDGDAGAGVTPLHFTAHTHDAAGTAYTDPGDRGVSNVEQALRSLYASQRVLEVESGSGQTGAAQQVLAKPLRVRLSPGQWSDIEEVPQVRFSAIGGGRLAASQGGTFIPEAVIVGPVEGEDGVYECWWELGPDGAQEVQAHLVLTGTPNRPIAPVSFHAVLAEAQVLHYVNPGATTATTVKAALDDLFAAGIPVGTIVDFASRSAIGPENEPPGFLICDGRSVERAEYAALFEVIGDSFGPADEATFTLPRLETEIPNLYKLIKY